jgi:ribonucleoside-diphosphate reductase alpha chain
MKKTLQSFENLSDLTLQKRYLMKDADGHIIETKDQMYQRVATAIAASEALYGTSEKRIKVLTRQFYRLMKKGLFLPNSPTLMNAGRKNGLLSACFVMPIEDSIDSIFTTVKNTALIQKAGGGTGFDFSPLRPTGDLVASSGGTTSGPISFMKVVSEATQAIQQGAFRRGANMGMMNIDHPDIINFINAKQDPTAFTNFNLSVKVSDEFMTKLKDSPDSYHIVTNPRTGNKYVIPHLAGNGPYSIEELFPECLASDDCYTTRQIWDMIVQNAHQSGEPGICFIDRVNQFNPTPLLGKINATNPCGEQPLLKKEACNLGSINVAAFIHHDNRGFDWNALKRTVQLAVRFLDNVIDANSYPIPEIKLATVSNRKIGLGVMGFADALILQDISYNSDEAIEFAKKVMSFIQEQAHQASSELAKERGCFANYKGSVWDTQDHIPMRNAAVTTIAPTGSISIIAGCSSGIEPVFSFAYRRKALDGGEFLQIHPLLETLGTEQGWLDEAARNMLLAGKNIHNIPGIPEKLRSTLVTAHDVSPEQHVNIQAAFQEYTDNAVSKTVNLPSDTSVEDVDKIFRLAYQLGCKGTTIYRNQSRQNQVITAVDSKIAQNSNMITPRARSQKTQGETIKYTMGCGKLYVSVNKDEQGLCEVFANLGKAGGCPAQSEATCRIVSAAIRSGVDPRILIEQLKGIRCLSTISSRKTNKNIDVLSCPDAIARAIEEALGDSAEHQVSFTVNKCPDCGFPLRRDSGCNICDNCGFSKCG